MRSVQTKTKTRQSTVADADAMPPVVDHTSIALAMMQSVIPLGLRAVEDALPQEVTALAGPRYAHGDATPGVARWGSQLGSIFLADQKVPITVPRVREVSERVEIPLAT